MPFHAIPRRRARVGRCLVVIAVAMLGLGEAVPVAAQGTTALTATQPVSTLVKVANNGLPLKLLTSPDGIGHLLTDVGLYTDTGGAWHLDAAPIKPIDIAIDSTGRLFAVAVATGTMTVATHAAGSWVSETVALFNGATCSARIAAAANGDLAVLCTGDRVELYRRTAGTWSGPEVLAGSGATILGSPIAPLDCEDAGVWPGWLGPAAVFTATGMLHVIVGGIVSGLGPVPCDPGEQIATVDLTTGTTGWSLTTLPRPTARVDLGAVVDAAGAIHVASHGEEGGCDYATNATGTWAEPPVPADALGSCSIAAGPSGAVLLYDTLAGLRRAVHSPSGWTISVETEVPADRQAVGSLNAAGVLRVAFGRNGGVWVLTGPGPVGPTAAIAPPPAVTPSSSLLLHWGGSAGTRPIATYDVQVRYAPWYGNFGSYAWLRTSTPSVRGTVSVAAGRTYCFRSRARDTHGLVSAWTAETCTAVPLDDRSLARSSGWTSGLSSRYYRGTYLATTRYRASLVRTGVVARRLSLVATTCPSCGAVRVYLGSTLLRTVSLYSPTAVYRRVIDVASFSNARSGTVTIRVSSVGRPVYLDGLAVRRN